MKTRLLCFVALATMLTAIPVSALAPLDSKPIRSSVQKEDIRIQALLIKEVGFIPSHGEVQLEFYYNHTFGNEIRYTLRDENRAGMTIKIYNQDNKQVATAKTTKFNNYFVNRTFRPPSSYDGKYRLIIVPDDGGSGYKYDIGIRAF
ncbi:hypothetical protein [Paenibacillus sp. 481]|uniref:hypothetical protein n=1 Tax=Paenibacillus sp. 481 TaxID=2835869 RepID=UPI001E3E8F1A|nr:hypothetical protein [Paenibacillus sp. 481]UHA72164.1 hypothetical protein KIK04_15825 [Paenibacillus sp. 481]